MPYNLIILSVAITSINLLVKLIPILLLRREMDKMLNIRDLIIETFAMSSILFLILLMFDIVISASNTISAIVIISIFGATFFTTYEFVIKPVILYYTSTNLISNKNLVTNISEICPEEHIRLKIINKDILNAYATGVIGFTRHILVGKSLIQSLSKDSLTSILFHELGHIKGKHMMYIFLSAFTISSIYGISVALFYPLFERISFTPLWIFIHGAGFGLFIILLPSIIQKRCEYSADAFAASMVGKEKYIKALIELDNLSNGLVSKGGLTHPTLKKRIDHINALQ